MSSLFGRRLHSAGGGAILAPLSFLGIFYIIPLMGIVAVSFLPDGELSLKAYSALFANDTFSQIVWRTIRLSLIVSLICLVLGYPFAYYLQKANGPFHSLLMLVVIVPFFTSILIRSYAWVAVLGNRGILNKLLISLGIIDSPIALIYNETGALIGMTQVQLPLMILTLYGAMKRIDSQLLDAGAGLGAHRFVVLSKVFFPLSLPGVYAGLGLVFTSTLGFYVTPALMGGARDYMVTQSIYVQMNNLGDFSGAAAQATVLLTVIILLLIVLRNIVSRAGGPSENNHSKSLGVGTIPERLIRVLGPSADLFLIILKTLSVVIVSFVTLFLTITMLVVIPLGFSGDQYLRFPPSSLSTQWIQAYLSDNAWLSSTWFSVWISVAGAALATILASIAAYGVKRVQERRGTATLELLFISPMIIPQFVVALALYFIFIKLNLVGSPVPYVVCYGVFGFPYAFLIMHAAFQRFDNSVVQAAANLGSRTISTWRRIVVPILLPSFLSASGFAFLTAFDDLVLGLFFSSGGQYTLPMRMWADIRTEISPKIAAVAVIFFGCAISAILVSKLSRRLLAKE